MRWWQSPSTDASLSGVPDSQSIPRAVRGLRRESNGFPYLASGAGLAKATTVTATCESHSVIASNVLVAADSVPFR
jgi:hypothetical protein